MDFDSYARRLWAGRADAYEDVVQQSGGTPADLDDAMEAVLASAGIELPADGRAGHRVSTLDPGQRQEMVTQLMMQRNKVTHIYELVKAYGSTMQIRFNRQDKRWDRVEALVEKHAREYAVNLLDGVTARPRATPRWSTRATRARTFRPRFGNT